MDACLTYLHLNISMTLKRAGIELQGHKSVRNVASLHHQSTRDRGISAFKFLCTWVGESLNHSCNRGILYFRQHTVTVLAPSIPSLYTRYTWCQVYHIMLLSFMGSDGKLEEKTTQSARHSMELLFREHLTKTLFPWEYWETSSVHPAHATALHSAILQAWAYMKHTWAQFGKYRNEDQPTDWRSVKQSQSDYICLHFIKRKATPWQC